MSGFRRATWLHSALWLVCSCGFATGILAEDSERAEKEAALSVPGAVTRWTPTERSGPLDPQGAPVGIESLFQLPDGFITTAPRSVAGASESEWRRRFKDADSGLSEARASLESTKRELDGVAVGGSSSQWSVAPPGGGNSGAGPASTSPLSFRLRQQLREDRERIETTEKAVRELRIEADLAGVPESWRGGPGSPGRGGSELD